MVVNTQTERVVDAQNAVDRVPARQPPARLPGLRQGRRVPAAGHHLRLGPRPQPRDRAQAPLRQAAGALAADRDRPRALHPLLPLRALQPGDRRGLAADLHRARRPHVRRHPRRPPVRGAVQRQHHRALPGRRADLAALPLPRPPVGHRGRRRHLHALPVAVQRRVHRPRRQGRARARRARTRASTTAGCATRAASPTRRSTSTSASPRRSSASGGELQPASGSRRSSAAARDRRAPRPRRRARRRPGDQRGGVPARPHRCARACAPTTSTRASSGPSGATLDLARALAAPALQASVAGPRVRPHGAGARHRAARRLADPRPADPQGRAPQRRQARDRQRPPEHARPERGSCRSATRPVARPSSWPRSSAALARQRRLRRPSHELARAAARRRRGRRDPVGRVAAAPTRCAALLRIADKLGLAGRDGAGLLEVPAGTNAPRHPRGRRAAQRRPRLLRGRAPAATPPRSPRPPPPATSPRSTSSRSIRVRDLPGRARLGAGARHAATSSSPTPRC